MGLGSNEYQFEKYAMYQKLADFTKKNSYVKYKKDAYVNEYLC